MTRHRVNCVTCGSADYADGATPPAGWGLECNRCREGTSGRPKKTLRHCSYCRADIVVMGVSGGVRLICPKCAKGNGELINVEKSQKEILALMGKLSDAEEHLATARSNLQKMEMVQEAELRKVTADIKAENLNLKLELQKKAEQTLADRIKAKMEAKPWQTKRETVREFLQWFAVCHEDLDVEETLDRYFHVDG